MLMNRFCVVWCVGFLLFGLPAAGGGALAAEKSHPIIAGFERFHAKGNNAAADGRLLLGELNCTACHAPSKSLAGQLLPKQAPILDGIGSRVSVEFLRKFIADPHSVKPGTTMPQLLAGLPSAERKVRVEALVHFLASTGTLRHTPPNRAAAGKGLRAFHRVGCVACHGSLRAGAQNPPGVVPLGEPAKKYSVTSLTNYLRDPLKTRPSGRMPNLNLTADEASSIAAHFLRDLKVPTNLTFKYYEGNWSKLPDFDRLKPKASGGVTGFDLRAARRKNNFGMRFEGYLQVERAGDYTFFLGSDDGSKLYLDGKLVVANDGIHAHSQRRGRTRLTKGPHAIRVDYFQGGGEWTLNVDYQGPGVRKRPAAVAITSTKIPPPPKSGFKIDRALVKRGRALFASVGCASCHQLKEKGKRIASTVTGKPLAQLRSNRACVATTPATSGTAPFFQLNQKQRNALAAVLTAKPKRESPDEQIARTMTTFNCYGCHSRAQIGGPPRALNPLFETTIKEMGDEGRVPPPLDGVGDKLTTAWLKHVMNNGANDRPYMLTRMPRFGLKNVGGLVDAFVSADRKTLVKIPTPKATTLRVKAAGRHMVGEKAFACIKCHTFGKFKATGIQSLDLTRMTQRIREDWFHRYMMKPIRYRPGTRMPTPFPGGISLLDNVLDGEPPTQLAAIWTYLKDGAKARVPMGLIQGKIPLIPKTEPIIYRNFIQGISPRGIAVGYPGGMNLAFDADRLVLGLIWHGAFIDASRHWQGRGQGFQPPLGDHVVSLPREAPFAALERIDAAWPRQAAGEMGYKFRGYRLNDKRQPIFQYAFGSIVVEDAPQPVAGEIDPSLKRTLRLRAGSKPSATLFLAAAGKSIEARKDGWYRVDNSYDVRVSQNTKTKPILRKSAGRFELLIPVQFTDNKAELVQEIKW